jgi:hypothetical protein
MSDLPRRNGWMLAGRPARDRTPDRMQRLLSRAVWDAAAVTIVVRRFAVAGLARSPLAAGRGAHRKRTSVTLPPPAPGPYRMAAATMQLERHERGIHVL